MADRSSQPPDVASSDEPGRSFPPLWAQSPPRGSQESLVFEEPLTVHEDIEATPCSQAREKVLRVWSEFHGYCLPVMAVTAVVWEWFQDMTRRLAMGIEGSTASAGPMPKGWLLPGESSLFYQRTEYAMGIQKGVSEVMVTPTRVVITQTEALRGPISVPLRQRQQCLDRKLVRGYESGLVIPTCRTLWCAIFSFCVSWIFLQGYYMYLLEVPRLILQLSVPDIMPAFRFAGGPCSSLDHGLCENATLSDALGFTNGRALLEMDAVATPRLAPRAIVQNMHVNSIKRARSNRINRKVAGRGGQHGATLIADSDLAYASTAATKPLQHGCKSFPGWVDSEGSGCAQYADPTWRLSCTSVEKVDRESLEELQDSTALHLGADDACCVCGGGEEKARAVAVDHLEKIILPLAFENSEVSRDVTSSAMLVTALKSLPSTQLLDMGKTLAELPVDTIVTQDMKPPSEILSILKVVQDAATGLVGKWMFVNAQVESAYASIGSFSIKRHPDGSNHHLLLETTTGSSAQHLIGDLRPLAPEKWMVEKVLKESLIASKLPPLPPQKWMAAELLRGTGNTTLRGTIRVQLRDHLMIANFREPGSSEWSAELEAKRILAPSLLVNYVAEHHRPFNIFEAASSPAVMLAYAMGVKSIVAIRCMIRVIAALALIQAGLTILIWLMERFYCSRIYVVLKPQAQFFGVPDKPKLWQPNTGDHDISSVYGFYLPDAFWKPGRLPAFALALITDSEEGLEDEQVNIYSNEPRALTGA